MPPLCVSGGVAGMENNSASRIDVVCMCGHIVCITRRGKPASAQAFKEARMPFSLPTADRNPAAREAMGDLAHVAEILNPANLAKMPDFSRAIRTPVPVGASAVFVICLRSDSDERWLIRVGPRGGWRKVWNFGTGRA